MGVSRGGKTVPSLARSKRMYAKRDTFKSEWDAARCSLVILQDVLREKITPAEARTMMRGMERRFRARGNGAR